MQKNRKTALVGQTFDIFHIFIILGKDPVSTVCLKDGVLVKLLVTTTIFSTYCKVANTRQYSK